MRGALLVAMKCLPPIVLAAAWLFALGMLIGLAFFRTYDPAITVAATVVLSGALACYWWLVRRLKGSVEFRRAYSRYAFLLAAIALVCAAGGIVKHGLETFAPAWMMDRAELAIYESPDAFIRSAEPYVDHGPRLAYNMGVYPGSRTQQMFDESGLLKKAYREIFHAYPLEPQARLRKLSAHELTALMQADKALAMQSFSDYGRRELIPYLIGALLILGTAITHGWLHERLRHRG